MYCINCGTEIREGARFCPVCGADQSGAMPGESGRERTAARTSSPRREAAPTRRLASAGRKKSRAGAVIAVILALALLAGGGYLLYAKVIFPKNTVKNAETLVQFLATSPLRDSTEDFKLRCDFNGKDYYAISDNREAELKLKDYLKSVYARNDYSAWVHSLRLLQDSGLYYVPDELQGVLDKKDVQDLLDQGGAVNLNYGWYSDSDHVYAVYSEYPGFRNEENYDVYLWGDVMAVRSHEYGWELFYRGFKLEGIDFTRWSVTSSGQIEYLFQSGRQNGTLLILPYDSEAYNDCFFVLDTATGDHFIVEYDF